MKIGKIVQPKQNAEIDPYPKVEQKQTGGIHAYEIPGYHRKAWDKYDGEWVDAGIPVEIPAPKKAGK